MTSAASSFADGLPDRMMTALNLPNGARFYRCALQINPFEYLRRHNKPTAFDSEDEYNEAIVQACRDNCIEVIAVTDHYRVSESITLLQSARNAGLFAFSGFEAVTKDGVHFLCLFDPSDDQDLERRIGECGIPNNDQTSPTGKLDSGNFLAQTKDWGATCIAAHVASAGGLLKTLSGQTRINVWKDSNLLACVLPGSVDDAPVGIRPILKNKEAMYRRDRSLAILNASDVNAPDDLKKPSASCFIKMSNVSVEGLRQAFLDHESRIRLHSSPPLHPHAEFLAITWEGGFLRDTAVRFNENLNVLVGGRGTGKSTMIESIRYVLGLEPLGEEARKAHEGVVRHVLQPGTKVSLLLRSHKPSERCYTVERSVPNPPVVKDKDGQTLALSPLDVVPGVEVYGQHEISELTRNPEKLTLLLERFIDQEQSSCDRKSQLRHDLERSRNRIVDVCRNIMNLEERLAALPGLEETQDRFQQAGLEERLKEKSLLIREERLYSSLEERLDQYRMLHKELVGGLPVDTAFVSDKALSELPNANILADIQKILEDLSRRLKAVGDRFGQALSEAQDAIAKTKQNWNEKRIKIEETYEKLLRDLQKSGIDGAQFIQLRQRIEELRPLKDKAEALGCDLQTHQAERRHLLVEWEDIKAAEYRKYSKAARRVSSKLKNRVRVEVTMAGNIEPLTQLLRDTVGGNLSAAFERLQSEDHLSLPELSKRCREGGDSLVKHYTLPSGAAERIARAGPELFMKIEELELPATTKMELNTAPEGEPENWQALQNLSTGQKATAVLLLLLLDSETPLIVDQPEDDLDNRFITEGVVPIMREEKRRRQFIFSTHNANIPVLGDAELILGLAATGEAKEGQAKIVQEHMGSIDSVPVRELVEEILEGGKAAFEMRRSKYGF